MECTLPLGALKQITLKLDSVLDDFSEVAECETIDDYTREQFASMSVILREMLNTVYATVQKELDEEAFKNEHVEMDEIEDLYSQQIEI